MFYNFLYPNVFLFWKLGYSRSNSKYIFFSADEMNNIDSEGEVFAEELPDKESDYEDSDDEDI